jgi:4'-phosphopantetheinyl transferase
MTGPIDWETAAQIPELDANQVDLIAVRLDLASEILERFRKTLSPNENVRAARFVFKEHQTRFVACRGALRSLLGWYLSCNPAAVSLRAGDHGKLRLADPGLVDIRFNLTHSEELAVFAFALSREVGVDLERIQENRNFDEIAERSFSQQERLDLSTVPLDDRVAAFFRCWTRKEAYLKARGEGLSVRLSSFDVSVLREDFPKLTAEDSARWTLRTIMPTDDFVGAVAFEGRNLNVRLRWYRPLVDVNS